MNRRRFLIAFSLRWAAINVLLLNVFPVDSYGAAIVRAVKPWLSDDARVTIFAIGTTLVGAVTGYALTSALGVSARARRTGAMTLAIVAGLTVVVNLLLAAHPLPDDYPWQVHLALTLPLTGAITGVLLIKLGSATSPSFEQMALAAITWAGAFSAGAIVAYVADYVVLGITIDVFESLRLSAELGRWVGAAAAGLLSGVVVGSCGRASLGHGPTATRSLADPA